MRIVQLRFDTDAGTWSLYARGRNERWFLSFDLEPVHDIGALLAEIDADPTGTLTGRRAARPEIGRIDSVPVPLGGADERADPIVSGPRAGVPL